MIHVTISEKGGKPTLREFPQEEINIGRVQGNEIVLPKSNVSKRHAKLIRQADLLQLIDAKSTNGTFVNGRRVYDSHTIQVGDKIVIGDYTLECRVMNKAIASEPSTGEMSVRKPAKTTDYGGSKSEVLPLDRSRSKPSDGRRPSEMPVEISHRAAKPGPPSSSEKPELRQVLEANYNHGIETLADAVQRVHERLATSTAMFRVANQRPTEANMRERISELVHLIVEDLQQQQELPSHLSAKQIIEMVMSEAIGLGPIEPFLQDPSVTEILINNHAQVFVEQQGQLRPTSVKFSSDAAIIALIQRIMAPLGRRIDYSHPLVDGRLADGSRVNAVLPPLATKGPSLTIRKFSREPLQIDDLVANGALNADMAEFLEISVQARRNIVVCGGTGSGKTTLLNVLSSFIDANERIVTIEDAAELKLDQVHVVSLEARPMELGGVNAITIRDLVRNSLRMRPDRIIIGECRGGEALDMLQAMNTGHDGSLTTIHANSPRDGLSRLETMVLMSGMELPIRAIREQVASAVDLIVQQARFADGSRRITHISEVVGMEGEILSMHDLFVFENQGFGPDGRIQGKFKASGFVPKFFEELALMGLTPNVSLFRKV